MPTLVPQTASLAERVSDAARRGDSVYVEGPVGAGRTALVDALEDRDTDRTAIVHLLSMHEPDAAGVALLEAASYLPASGAPEWVTGSGRELHVLARDLGDRLRDHNKILVLRIPDSWQGAGFSPRTGDVLPLRARSVLSGFLRSAVGLVVVADAALNPSHLGFHPAKRFQLPRHTVGAESLSDSPWGEYTDAFKDLCVAGTSIAASPLAWRLAVGCIALGAAVKRVIGQLKGAIPLPPLTNLLAKCVRRDPKVTQALTRFLAVRRPIEREAVPALTGVSDTHLPLLTECVGYGDALTRVSAVVRGLLRNTDQVGARSASDNHKGLAQHYAKRDGAPSPTGLSPAQFRAWSERAHHLAIGADVDSADWKDLQLPAPSFYWDRGRHLSLVTQNYQAAAQVYQSCVKRFPEDDYSWHYMAFNQMRARGNRQSVSVGYRKAIELNVENPWWNRRLVEFLIRDGAVCTAQQEWRLALDRVDPDGTQVRRSGWLAHNFHLGVCRAWINVGRYNAAKSVLELVPDKIKNEGPLASLARRADSGPEAWKHYLVNLPNDERVGPQFASQVVSWWEVLDETVPLPAPLAELTADHERFQFAWSFQQILIELEVHRDGMLEWFAKDRETGDSEDGEQPRSAGVEPALKAWLERISDA